MAVNKKKPSNKAVEAKRTEAKRAYVSQTDIPALGLDQALRVPRAIADSYGKNPTRPLRVAEALNMSPTSGTFRMLCGAAIAYGLTEGGYNSAVISLTPLGRRIVAPTEEGDDDAARREAVLRPRILREFLTRYNGSKVPAKQIARNVLEEMGVPADRTEAVFDLLVQSADAVGFLLQVKDQTYIDLGRAVATIDPAIAPPAPNGPSAPADETTEDLEPERGPSVAAPPVQPPAGRAGSRVFITHGSNREIVEQLKDLLTFGGFTPVIAIETETTSKPLPDKIMDGMKMCSAAIIHVGTEARLMDPDGKEHRKLNENVLIEIGAALALYGRKFILLVEDGVTLPTNLRGLYEVRYKGEKLDYESTMKLLKAFNDFRS